MPRLPPRRCRVSPGEEFHTVRLPKGWTPARVQRFAECVERLNMAGHLDAEVRALRRERRELRKLLKRGLVYLRSDGVRASVVLLEDIEKALAPKRRRKA